MVGGPLQRRRVWRWLLALAALVGLAVAGFALWSPYPRTERRFDRGSNGLWIGHRWLTGKAVRTGKAVAEEELQQLLATLRENRIRWVYLHAGPIRPDGTVADLPGGYLAELVKRAPPEVRFLPWMGALAGSLALDTPAVRQGVLSTLQVWRDAGFPGVHLNVEPLRDQHPGYLELLREIRERFGPGYVISHATMRAGPFGIAVGPMRELFWSQEYYRELMRLTDQTVLMAYETAFTREKTYVGFVQHQTRLMLEWACAQPGHRVLIGIPSFEDPPRPVTPLVETPRNAALGVRAALEERGESECFEGVAVYAEWVTDPTEWQAYRTFWMQP